MEYEENDDEQGFFQRLKESPRTVSALIIILIVAAAIYAFSGEDAQDAAVEEPIVVGELESEESFDVAQDEPEEPMVVEEEPVIEELVASLTDEDEATLGAETATPEPVEVEVVEEAAMTPAPEPAPIATMAPVDRRSLAEEVQTLPEASQTEEGYVEAAVAGDGMTHLARRAASRWLAENGTDYAVTNEHRIYIEDYIKDRMGRAGLGLGEERTIAFSLIEEAVAAAGQLNERQLQNLSQYTHALT